MAVCLAAAALIHSVARGDRARERARDDVEAETLESMPSPAEENEVTDVARAAPGQGFEGLLPSPRAPAPTATATVPPPPHLLATESSLAEPLDASAESADASRDASSDAATAAAVSPPDAAPAPGPPCGKTVCPSGKVCCNASCGTCVKPGERCSQLVCGMPVMPESVVCGTNTCNVGELCCNASCGICVSPGQECDRQRRCSNEIQVPESHVCGMQTCNVGLVCCNPSCGICAPPGEPCSQQPCS